MTEQDRGAADGHQDPERDPLDGVSSDDLRLDASARALLERFWKANDGSALEPLAQLLGPRLASLEPLILGELGALIPLDLPTEWFTWLLTSELPADGVPRHPLAAAREWMEARGRGLLSAFRARPLPWEDGYDERLPAEWLGRLAIQTDEPLSTYVNLITLHRLPRLTRQVMRAKLVDELSTEACARTLQLSPGQVEEHERAGRLASLEAIDRLLRGDEA